MSFTIIRNLEQVPSYTMLCKLAEQNQVRVVGNECSGSFSYRDVEGNYEFDTAGTHGKFAGYGVVGEFCFEIGRANVTVLKKPFWLPEAILKQKIGDGLDALLKTPASF
jgi:hypothetical protein